VAEEHLVSVDEETGDDIMDADGLVHTHLMQVSHFSAPRPGVLGQGNDQFDAVVRQQGTHSWGRCDLVGPMGASWSSRGDAGSSDEQAKAKVRHFEIKEFAVTFGPPTRSEVITETSHCPLLDFRPNSGPHRYAATNVLVKVRLRPTPVRLEETINAIPRNQHRLNPSPDRAGQLSRKADTGGHWCRR
jgi:hypothetical protein